MMLKSSKFSSAFTLVEVMVAMAILAIAVLGAMGFRYYSALDARKADVQNYAARVSSLLLESWKGLGGLERFDPVETFGEDFIVSESDLVPPAPSGFTKLGGYQIEFYRTTYYVTLSYKEAALSIPRALNVSTSWVPGNIQRSISDGYDLYDRQYYDYESMKYVKLTTYVGY
ncbi:prepilin-type N-terminal cleavage/methylation domain-containing protein [Planctomycetota bacterium]